MDFNIHIFIVKEGEGRGYVGTWLKYRRPIREGSIRGCINSVVYTLAFHFLETLQFDEEDVAESV